jgi:hypothetical protein
MAMLICAVSSVKTWQQVEKVSPAFLHNQNDALHTHPVVKLVKLDLDLDLDLDLVVYEWVLFLDCDCVGKSL